MGRRSSTVFVFFREPSWSSHAHLLLVGRAPSCVGGGSALEHSFCFLPPAPIRTLIGQPLHALGFASTRLFPESSAGLASFFSCSDLRVGTCHGSRTASK